jgi:probable rRNA maturation factor
MPKPEIRFFSQNTRVNLSHREELTALVERIFRKERRTLQSLNCVFCSDQELLRINKLYLNHLFLTDVITFDLSDSKKIVAEIYISADRVRENAKLFRVPVTQEFHRVIIHGILHLCGYDDKSERQKRRMQAREGLYLDMLNRKRST